LASVALHSPHQVPYATSIHFTHFSAHQHRPIGEAYWLIRRSCARHGTQPFPGESLEDPGCCTSPPLSTDARYGFPPQPGLCGWRARPFLRRIFFAGFPPHRRRELRGETLVRGARHRPPIARQVGFHWSALLLRPPPPANQSSTLLVVIDSGRAWPLLPSRTLLRIYFAALRWVPAGGPRLDIRFPPDSLPFASQSRLEFFIVPSAWVRNSCAESSEASGATPPDIKIASRGVLARSTIPCPGRAPRRRSTRRCRFEVIALSAHGSCCCSFGAPPNLPAPSGQTSTRPVSRRIEPTICFVVRREFRQQS